jgi:hypothetical protein
LLGPFSTAFRAMEFLHRRDKLASWIASIGGALVLAGLFAITTAPSAGGLPLPATALAVAAASLIVWLTRHPNISADEAAKVAAGTGILMRIVGAGARVMAFAATTLLHLPLLPAAGRIALAAECVSLVVGRWLERMANN